VANLFIVTTDSAGMSHWMQALDGHYNLQLVDHPRSVVTHKPKLGVIDLIILDADFIIDDFNELSLMVSSGNKTMIVGNSCSEEIQVRSVVEGAWGYSEKSISSDVAHRVVKSVLNNQIWLERHQISMIVALLKEKNGWKRNHQAKFIPKHLLTCLTQRELDVAELIFQGEGNSSIALKLNISERTVKAHASSVFRKLDVQDRFQLVIFLKNLNVKNSHED
jgi:two-component system nitrate/nitrite response regulator NarL